MQTMCDNWLRITEITKRANRKWFYFTLEVVAIIELSVCVHTSGV